MLNLKDIFSIVQNQLLEVSDSFTSVSDCVFPDDAELTLKIINEKVSITYSEIKHPDDYNSDLIVTFKNIFMSDLQNKDSLRNKIKEEIIKLASINDSLKLKNDFRNISSKLNKNIKDKLLSHEEVLIKLQYDEYDDLKIKEG